MAIYTYTGTSANNTISPGENYTAYYIDGGAGVDTVFIDAARSSFTISPIDASGVVTISGASAASKKLYLTNIEKVTFKSGGTVDLPTAPITPTPINGTSGNDSLTGTSGNNTFDGGLGIDTVMMTGVARAAASLSQNGGNWSLSSASTGTDTLINVERLQFSDKKIALDLAPNGNAGESLEFIGIMAFSLIHDPAVIGTILSIFDQNLTMTQVCQMAIDVGLTQSLAGSNSNADLARLVFRNVVGVEADAATTNLLVGYMDGTYANYSQAQFLATIATLDLNQTHIGLVGLQQTGIEYIPPI